jgi:mono/diheme cytochrome c family protein
LTVRKLHPLLLGWLAGIATVALVGAVFAALILFAGIYNTGADNPHLRFVAWAFHQTMNSSVKQRSRPLPAGALSHADILAGARDYETHCIACHGGPGVARAPWTSALLPTPPYLLDSARRWSPAELATIVRDGVKMTAMPAWSEIEPNRDVTNIVAVLVAMPRLTPAGFARLRAQARAAGEPCLLAGPVLGTAPPRPGCASQ